MVERAWFGERQLASYYRRTATSRCRYTQAWRGKGNGLEAEAAKAIRPEHYLSAFIARIVASHTSIAIEFAGKERRTHGT